MANRTITQNQYWQLVGLLALGKSYMQKIEDITSTALAITDEHDSKGILEPYGHTADAIVCGYTAEKLLGLLEIEVDGTNGERDKQEITALPYPA